MKSFIIKSKDQDLSFIPVNSFVYFDGCGFVKHSPFITKWEDVDEDQIICSKNETLKKLIKSPSVSDVFSNDLNSLFSDEQVSLQEADYLWFVIYGEQEKGKGATITEIDFYDIMGKKIEYNFDNFVDIKLSNDEYWEGTDNWEGENLFNGDLTYLDEETGKKSSTLFNVGQEEGISSFYIHFDADTMKIISDIRIYGGSPEGRIPKAVAVFAVKNKDDKDKRVQTLLFMKTFKKDIDGVMPPVSAEITQDVNMENPCLDLFKKGYTQSGIHIIKNPITKKLEPIYCEFPEVIKEEEGEDFLKDLCNKNPYTKIVVKDENNVYKQMTVAEYLKLKKYVCYYKNCENRFGEDYNLCMQKLCEAVKINPNAKVKLSYIENDEIKEKEILVSEYLVQKNFKCDEEKSVQVVSDEKEIIENVEELLKEGYNDEILFVNPATGEKFKITPQEYMEIYNSLNKPNTIQKLVNDGWKVENTEDEEDPCLITLVKDGQEIKVKKPECLTQSVYIDDVENGEGTATIELKSDETQLKAIDEDASNIKIIDEKGIFEKVPNDIDLDDINIPKDKILYKVEVENVEVPVLDEQGNVVIDKETNKPKTKIEQKLKITFISIPDGMKDEIQKYKSKLYVSDGMNETFLNIDFRPPVFEIKDSMVKIGRFSTPLQKFNSKYYKEKFPDGVLKVSFEYNEGCLLSYFGAKGDVEVEMMEGVDEKLKIEIEKTNLREGKIKILSKLDEKDIVEGFLDFPIKFKSNDEEIDILVRVMKHIRVQSKDYLGDSILIGDMMVDDIKKVSVYNINHKNPLVMTPSQFRGYTTSYGRGDINVKMDVNQGPCYNAGIELSIDETTIEDIKNEKRVVSVKGIEQTNRENTIDGYRRFYIVDPIFNQANMKNEIISPDEVYVVEAKYNVDRLMEINGVKNQYKIDLNIDKYRFYNSKTGFDKNIFNTERYQMFRDFKIFYQTEGLNVKIEDPNVCGLKIATRRPSEDVYFKCKKGAPEPIPFRILTLDKNIGKTKIIMTDTKNQVIINVNVYQTIDVNYPKDYKIENPFLGSSVEIELLHPYDDNWEKVKGFADDDRLVETSIIKKDDGKYYLKIDFIGVEDKTTAYVTDFHRTIGFDITNIQFTDKLTAKYSKLKLLNTDHEIHEIPLFNVKGDIKLEFDNSKLEVNYDDENKVISVKNLIEENYSEKIKVIETTDVGNEEIYISILTFNNIEDVNSKAGLPTLNIDDSEVYFDIEKGDESDS